jgi:broad specificity phosphatase PhoE
MRHGEAENNVANVLSSSIDEKYHLTWKGRRQVSEKASLLKKTEQIDFIISSPVTRACETAKIVAECFDIPTSSIRIDSRLREPFFGKVEGKTYQEYLALIRNEDNPYELEAVDGEKGSAIIQRINELLKEFVSAEKFYGKTILLVTHSFTICQILKIFGKDQKELPNQADCFIFELN